MYRRGTTCTDRAGRVYRSKLERDRSEELQLLARTDEIRGLVYQPPVTLYAGIVFRPDFAYWQRSRLKRGYWRLLYEDTKADIRIGGEAQKMRMIEKLWRTDGPAPLRFMVRARDTFRMRDEFLSQHLWYRSDASWETPDPVVPARKRRRRVVR